MLLAASARRSAPRALWRTLSSGSSRKQQQLSITSEMRIGVAANYRVEGSAEEGFTFSRTPVETHLPGRPAPHESFRSQARGFLRATFLPVGYPTAVGRGYMDCVVWQAITNFALSANQVLASTFLLYAVGLGAGAIPTAGALNWVLKDGLGQMGTLVFGKTIAHNFDIHSKSWYFLSMILLQLATLVEIITIMAPQWFLLLGSAANCLKGLAWMANGSTRSVFNLAFARDNNIADITAKGTSQYICASMFGTVAGAALSGVVGQDTRAALVCFMALTGVALTSSYVTVKTIPLPTLNSTRLQLLCECYLGAISRAAAARQEQRALRLQQQLDEPPPTDMDAGMAPPRPRLPPSSGSSSGGAWGGGGGEASWGGHDEGWTDLGDGAGAGAGSSSSSSSSFTGQGKGACPDDSQRSSSPRQLWHQLASSFGRGGSSSSTYAYTAFSEAAWRRPLGRSGSGEGGSGAGDASFERLFDEFLDPLVPSPAELASEDPPLPFLMGDQRILNPAIIVGAGLDSLLEGASPELLVVMLTTFKLSRALVVPRGPAIHVLLHEQAGPRDMCQAYLQACLLRQRMREGAQLGAAASLHAACLIDPEGAADEAEWGVWDDPDPPAAKRRPSSTAAAAGG
ncbi:vitamin B6 photo-protection and homoeostasis-domain-containing protein [Haematococcus lacustris]